MDASAAAQPLPTSITALLAEASELYASIASGLEQHELGPACARCTACLTALQLAITQEGIFSANERVEDIDTEDLPLLAADFMLGSVHIKSPFDGAAARLQALERADTLLSHYLAACERVRILLNSDLEEWRRLEADEPARAPEQAREQKIARFKRQRASEQRRQAITSELRALTDTARTNSTTTSQKKDAAAAAQREGLSRESHVLNLQSYAREALDELSNISREKELLTHMLASSSSAGDNGSSAATDSRTRPSESSRERQQGLEVTRLSKVNGQLRMQKEVVRGRVFQPTVAPPTMTLEEFADIELADAMARAEREKAAPQADRRYAQLVADGDEDNEALADTAAVKDRAWDDWKDDHPKGYGNKANKRF